MSQQKYVETIIENKSNSNKANIKCLGKNLRAENDA